MAQDDNETIPELEDPNTDREVADDEGMDDSEWEEGDEEDGGDDLDPKMTD